MKFSKQIPFFEIILVSAIMIVHIYAALSDAYNFPNSYFSRDDAYYYFKVAQNISEGRGSTFDGINATNGYHPLWMAICIPIFALARFNLILPLRIMLVVMAALNAATSVLIYRLVKRNLSPPVAIIAASFWAFNLYIHSIVYEFGLETPLAAFAIALFIWNLSKFERRWRKNQPINHQLITLALIGTMVMFSRLDLIFFVVISGFWIIFRGKSIRFLVPLDCAAIFISMSASVVLRTGFEIYNIYFAASATDAAALSIVIKIFFLYFLGCFEHPRNISFWTMIKRIVSAMTIGSLALSTIYYLLAKINILNNLPRSTFITDWAISILLIISIRLAAHWFGNKNKDVAISSPSPLTELLSNWKKWLKEFGEYYGVVGGSLLIYMVFNKFYFGTSSPVSGQIKRWWGSIINIGYEHAAANWTSFFGINSDGTFSAWKPATELLIPIADYLHPLFPGSNTQDERYYLSMLIVLILALIVFALNAKHILKRISNLAIVPLMSGCAFQILSFSTTAYGGVKEWYWVSEMILITLMGSLLLDLVLRPIMLMKITRIPIGIASLVISIILFNSFQNYIRAIMPYNAHPANLPYVDVVPFLQDNTAEGSIIGMTGGGNIGYFIQNRTIVNMDGLINSNDYFHALQNRQAPDYLRRHGLQMVFANSQLLAIPPYYGQFDPYLTNINAYGSKGLFYLLDKPKN